MTGRRTPRETRSRFEEERKMPERPDKTAAELLAFMIPSAISDPSLGITRRHHTPT
jgi:hypothetical protein